MSTHNIDFYDKPNYPLIIIKFPQIHTLSLLLYHDTISPISANGIANIQAPNQTASQGAA